MSSDFDDSLFLIERLKEGSTEAYSYLIDCYYAKLYRYALNLTNDHNLAEDIVQNVYLNIWEKRKKINTSIPINKMLYKAVYNNFVNQYNKSKSIGMLEKKYVEMVTVLTEESDDAVLEKRLEILKNEIKNLPPKCQKIFLLSKQEGLTNKEISQYLDISINTVENHITKAFSILRKKAKEASVTIWFLLFGKKVVR